MNDISLLNEYVAWLIRNSYKDSCISPDEFCCDIFSVLISPLGIGIEANCAPSSISGLKVLFDDWSSSDFIVRLLLKPEDYNERSKRFLKSFYDLQSLHSFYYSDTWKVECGIAI